MKRRKIDPDTKIAAVLEGLKGESSIADLSCSSGSRNRDVSHYGINPSQQFFPVITDCSEHQHPGKGTPSDTAKGLPGCLGPSDKSIVSPAQAAAYF
jgi:hypothetical protein